MSTVLSILLAVVIAGAAAWLVRRMDQAGDASPTGCARMVTDALANSGDTPDSVLLSRLLPDRDRCVADAGYVDQVRRLMTNAGQYTEARALLDEADRRRAFKPDELLAQLAWVDAAESQGAWSDGDEARASALQERAVQGAQALRAKWPEWSLPYRILEDANRSGADPSGSGEAVDYYQLERAARAGKLNGAWIRSQQDAQPIVLTFVTVLFAMLALMAAVSSYLDVREISALETSRIASATSGYVELKGTLHVPAGAHAVIGPHTHEPAVWYEMESRSAMKKATKQVQRSGQHFVLRDASGEVSINPELMSVHTKHETNRFGNSAGQLTNARLTERLLKDGDEAFVLGELQRTTLSDGTTRTEIAVGSDGRRLFVSNYSEAELLSMERTWITLGITVFVVLSLLLAWAYYQRYHVAVQPGTLF